MPPVVHIPGEGREARRVVLVRTGDRGRSLHLRIPLLKSKGERASGHR